MDKKNNLLLSIYTFLKSTKKGKLLTSHRYDQLPLLRSHPGGFIRSWLCKTCPLQSKGSIAQPAMNFQEFLSV